MSGQDFDRKKAVLRVEAARLALLELYRTAKDIGWERAFRDLDDALMRKQRELG